MKDAHEAETEQATPYVRLPWPLVAVGLIAILAVVLGIGVLASLFSSLVVTHNLLAIILNWGSVRKPTLLGVDRVRTG